MDPHGQREERRMFTKIRKMMKDEKGAALAEYGLLLV